MCNYFKGVILHHTFDGVQLQKGASVSLLLFIACFFPINKRHLRLSGVLMSVSVSLCGVHTPTRGG